MKTIIVLTAAVMLVLLGCSERAERSGSEPERSAEEVRLEHSRHIDSTTLWAYTRAAEVGLSRLTAEAWLLVDDATGRVISQKNAHRRMLPASLTKMMTCLLALEHGHLDDTIAITPDVYIARNSRVKSGDSYRAADLLTEMMLQSDNDAAYALANHVAGDTTAFCQMMNSKATYLGMDSTHFVNPNGMPGGRPSADDPLQGENFTTARDLLVLARYAMSDTAFASIVRTPFADIPLVDGRHLPSPNTNELLRSYEGCIGVKTGFTRKAGFCLVSAARRGDTTLFLVLLKSKTLEARFTESAALLDYGFRIMEHYKKAIFSKDYFAN